MRAVMFDTLTYARKLQAAGFSTQQAEGLAEALRAVVDENLATKHDIELVRRDIEVMRRDIIIWLGSIVVVATTMLGVLTKIL